MAHALPILACLRAERESSAAPSPHHGHRGGSAGQAPPHPVGAGQGWQGTCHPSLAKPGLANSAGDPWHLLRRAGCRPPPAPGASVLHPSSLRGTVGAGPGNPQGTAEPQAAPALQHRGGLGLRGSNGSGTGGSVALGTGGGCGRGQPSMARIVPVERGGNADGSVTPPRRDPRRALSCPVQPDKLPWPGSAWDGPGRCCHGQAARQGVLA